MAKPKEDPMFLRQFWIPMEDIENIRNVRETHCVEAKAFPIRIMSVTMRVIDYKLYEEVLAENARLKAKLGNRG